MSDPLTIAGGALLLFVSGVLPLLLLRWLLRRARERRRETQENRELRESALRHEGRESRLLLIPLLLLPALQGGIVLWESDHPNIEVQFTRPFAELLPVETLDRSHPQLDYSFFSDEHRKLVGYLDMYRPGRLIIWAPLADKPWQPEVSDPPPWLVPPPVPPAIPVPEPAPALLIGLTAAVFAWRCKR